jgi:hypothetical protein
MEISTTDEKIYGIWKILIVESNLLEDLFEMSMSTPNNCNLDWFV